MKASINRFTVWREVLGTWWIGLSAFLSMLGAAEFLFGWQIPGVGQLVHGWAWLLLVLVSLLGGTLEGSYRAVAEREREIAEQRHLIDLSLRHLGWRDLFNGVGVFGIGLCVLGSIFIRNPRPLETAGLSGGIGGFVRAVVRAMGEVARIPHVWVASVGGACAFGTMLALGVVWGPKLLMVRGIESSTANLGASLLWLGLAAGCLVVPRWSDAIERRKLPIILGATVQLACLAALFYLPSAGKGLGMALCFMFGVANAVHMLAFSTAADVVAPNQIGTSAAIVNGLMFILAGVLIARPGALGSRALEAGIQPGTLELAQVSGRPLILAAVTALVIAHFMRETYPRSRTA